jgi:endonuclease YncB( thermonuclease family)
MKHALVLGLLLCAVYPVTAWRVVDGDTIEFDAVLKARQAIGLNAVTETTTTITAERVRLLGINTTERGRPGAAEATAFVKAWMTAAAQAEVSACFAGFARSPQTLEPGKGEYL